MSYLSRLKFDEKLRNSYVAKYITNIRLVILLIISIVAAGVISYINLPKRLNPEIKIPIVIVSTVLPGASPRDIESLLTIPIENKLQAVKGVDTLTSTSQDNVSVITLQFHTNVAPEKAKTDVQSEIDAIQDLPEDAQSPNVINLDFEDQPVWTFVLSTNKDPVSLSVFSDNLKQTLENLPEVSRVTLSGFEENEIAIIINPEKIQEYSFNPHQVASAIQRGLISYPAGTLKTTSNTYAFTIDPQIVSIQDIRNTRINIDGNATTIGEIAAVYERPKPQTKSAYIATTKKKAGKIVTFYIYKTQGTNIDAAGHAIKDEVSKKLKSQNGRFSVETISDTSEEIEIQFSELFGEFQTTVLLITLCLFIFLGLRQALLSALTVPLTFLASFFLMSLFGQSLNFLTLFAFILSLGLLIDDTIVVVSAMTSYYKTRKFTPLETGILVWRDTIIPIWSTTLTTIWSFIPLLLTTGIIGEFIKPLPIVVSTTMISSTAISILITLPLMVLILDLNLPKRVKIILKIIALLLLLGILVFLIPKNIFLPFVILNLFLLVAVFLRIKGNFATLQENIFKNRRVKQIQQKLSNISNHGLIDIEKISRKYHTLIVRILQTKSSRRKVIVAICIYALIGFLLIPLGLVKNEFFPESDQPLLYVSVDLPAGTNSEATKEEMLNVLESVRNTQDVDYIVAETGQQFTANFDRSEITSSGILTFHLPKRQQRNRSSIEIAEELRQKTKGFTKGKIAVIELSGGPPAGADIQISLLGSDSKALNEYADAIITFLKSQPATANVNKSVKPATPKITFVPDKDKLNHYGLGVETIGLWLRMYTSGFSVSEVAFGDKTLPKKDITIILNTVTSSPQDITALSIPVQSGDYVPLSELGTFQIKENPSLITREDRKRSITVSASVLPGFNIQDLNQKLTKHTQKITLPDGYEWKTGGVNEENEKSVLSIFQAMIIAFVLILVTMVVQFKSYRQAVIVLLVIPLAVSSVFYVFALSGTPLSFPALIGVLSLFGIVVTNSMFIVDKINLNRKQGMPFRQAIADAGASRLEPIVLTKLNTILGLLAITLSNPLWRGLGGTIISGVALASTIMLLFIPAVYYNWFNNEEK